MNRSEMIDLFLMQNGWQGAKRQNLAGDASFRRYERVFLGERQAVLMDAPPEKEDTTPFINVALHLHASGLSAPAILASDRQNGILLLEDLGDDLFARVLENNPRQEEALYLAAADALIQLYREASHKDYEGLAAFDMPKFLAQVTLLPEWFMPLMCGKKTPETLASGYLAAWREALTQLPGLRPVMVLYDFHAENLLWLPERQGAARAGLLDFQDAMTGSPAYDMVSFLEDARRDVSPSTAEKVVAHYLHETGIEREDFMAAYALMGAQRNCRIIGTFARLAVRDGKPRYLSFMPRVWGHIENDLRHPLLASVKAWIDEHIPPQWRGVPNL